MMPSDLDSFESSGKWIAQRKFNGSRCVVYISSDRYVCIGNRHGEEFRNFNFTKSTIDELLSSLQLENSKDYWLDGELMNKDKNPSNQIIFYDVLQAGRYMFGNPNQLERIKILNHICNNPSEKTDIALKISDNFLMAETFQDNFKVRFNEALPNQQLEGLVLRRIDGALDAFGTKEYVTTNLIRCRKPNPKCGYEF